MASAFEARSGGSHNHDVAEFLQSVNDNIVFHQIPVRNSHYAHFTQSFKSRAPVIGADVIRADFKRELLTFEEHVEAALKKDLLPVVRDCMQLEAEFIQPSNKTNLR
ncbi:hypothetical protein NPIL_182241 [Nephila pilipes]|uniref:Uncharacterized protein n=1 Tax=Nephila pilipes TaxID=299642 RepID=A0A8X6M7K1_NEPPI|nr:hypothetical protein NPIL_182241 [Nephila pilipes]